MTSGLRRYIAEYIVANSWRYPGQSDMDKELKNHFKSYLDYSSGSAIIAVCHLANYWYEDTAPQESQYVASRFTFDKFLQGYEQIKVCDATE